MSSIKQYRFRGDYVLGWEYEAFDGELKVGILSEGWMPGTTGLAFDVTNKENMKMPLRDSCYITREQVAELIPILQRFVDTGKLSADDN